MKTNVADCVEHTHGILGGWFGPCCQTITFQTESDLPTLIKDLQERLSKAQNDLLEKFKDTQNALAESKRKNERLVTSFHKYIIYSSELFIGLLKADEKCKEISSQGYVKERQDELIKQVENIERELNSLRLKSEDIKRESVSDEYFKDSDEPLLMMFEDFIRFKESDKPSLMLESVIAKCLESISRLEKSLDDFKTNTPLGDAIKAKEQREKEQKALEAKKAQETKDKIQAIMSKAGNKFTQQKLGAMILRACQGKLGDKDEAIAYIAKECGISVDEVGVLYENKKQAMQEQRGHSYI